MGREAEKRKLCTKEREADLPRDGSVVAREIVENNEQNLKCQFVRFHQGCGSRHYLKDHRRRMLLFNFIIALCLEMDLISKMKYKFCCVFFQLFFSCKKDTITRGTHAKIFNFVLTPVPDSHFSRLFSSPPPPLIRKRGEKISERTLDRS